MLLGWLLFCVTFYYAWRFLGRDNPWPRRFLSGVGRIAGARVKVVGSKPDGAFLVSNHSSWLDVPVIAGATGSAFVAHDGLAQFPLLRRLCEMNDTVFIARGNRASVAGQVRQVRQALHDTGMLTVFPEGTTEAGDALLPFKSSLLSALDPLPDGIAVHPLWVDYGPETRDIAWIGEEHGVANFLKIMARNRPLPVTLHILPALAGEALANRKSMAAAAQKAIEAAMAGARA